MEARKDIQTWHAQAMVVSVCVDKMKVRNETRKTWKPDQTAETVHPNKTHVNNWERYNIEHIITFFTSQETKTIGKLKLQEHGDYLTAEKNKLQAEMIGRCLAWVSGLALKRCKARSHGETCDQRRHESWQELWHHTPSSCSYLRYTRTCTLSCICFVYRFIH